MTVICKSSKYKAHVALLIFNKLYASRVVHRIIANMPKDMQHTNIDPSKFADNLVPLRALMLETLKPELKFYKTRNPWSAAYAKTYKGNYSAMYLNTRKLNRSIASICGTVGHEWGHNLESWYRDHVNAMIYFNHGTSNRRNDNTFQYQLGIRVKAYVEENESELLRAVGVDPRCFE